MIHLKVLLLEGDVKIQENGVMGRSLMTLMASCLGGFGLYTEIIGTSACIYKKFYDFDL